MNYALNDHIAEISPRPILFLVGEQAESRFFSDMAFKKAAEPKRMIVVQNCNHVDLYDDTSKIPFDEIERFLHQSLR